MTELRAGTSVVGLHPEFVCTIEAVEALGESARVIYRLPSGDLRDGVIDGARVAALALATGERPWSFDGDGGAFKLACEAKRIDLAYLFDPMMAVHTSNVEPLPHQITAVYEAMLPRTPLRFVLADDPGAGKTIMAGLYIRELIMRADARRILVVAPGSLVEQWRDELFEKFGLEFPVFSRDLAAGAANPNPFDALPQVIVRLDQMTRSEELQAKLCAIPWDLVVFDEAHKLAAHYYGSKTDKTDRFELAERLGAKSRHLLLMTATPHNGKEEDFQLFLSLLEADRFYGKFRDGVHKVDVTDLMRRMVKEELVKFDGTPLFPERRAYTVNYQLSSMERALYDAVTQYVQDEMGKADDLGGKRRGRVGFALTALQRRLASSPEAIYRSLAGRHNRLRDRLEALRNGRDPDSLLDLLRDVPADEDDLRPDEEEEMSDTLVDEATAAQTVAELEIEIATLARLEEQARELVASGQDRKWDELSRLLQGAPEMHEADGAQRKIIIFSEHRATLDYLHQRIAGLLGSREPIVTIHGGMGRDERRRAQAMFRSDKGVRVLVATDAAGEGVNLQVAHLMVNYDLPWNPNRLEQRFGRIHRIGQTEVCHLWSLVAAETREGAVWARLLEKLAVENEALKGKVFNILGDVFEEESLRDLMLEAIRYGNRPDVRAKLQQKVDNAFDHGHLRELLERNALAHQALSAEHLYRVKEEMERAEARRLQPHFVRAFFKEAFTRLGGGLHAREEGRFEVTKVPARLRDREQTISAQRPREAEPVLPRYERICFEREAVQPADRPGLTRAVLMHPGHPLMLAITGSILERDANLLRQGAVLVDRHDMGTEPWFLALLTHDVRSGDGQILSRRLQFVGIDREGRATDRGWAPHLDLDALDDHARPLLAEEIAAPWLRADLERQAIANAVQTLASEHFDEVAHRHIEQVDKTLHAVYERLRQEIDHFSDREIKLKDALKAGKDVRLDLTNTSRTLEELRARLDNRTRELKARRHVENGAPLVVGGALVIPQGLLMRLRGEAISPEDSVDQAARERIEALAMAAVTRDQEARGWTTKDVSGLKCGWDITSFPPSTDGLIGESLHIEVKGRVAGADEITVTANEVVTALNQGDRFVLAVVWVNPDDSVDGPHYVEQPFRQMPDWGETKRTYTIAQLMREGRGL